MSTIPDPCIRPLRSITRWPKGDPPIPLPPSVWLCCPGVWPCCGLRSEADLLLLLSTDGARLSSMSPSSLSADAARLSDDSLRNCSRNDICEMGLSKTEGDKRVNNYIKQLSGWQGKKKKKLTDYCADGTGRHANDRRLNGSRQKKKKFPNSSPPSPYIVNSAGVGGILVWRNINSRYDSQKAFMPLTEDNNVTKKKKCAIQKTVDAKGGIQR